MKLTEYGKTAIDAEICLIKRTVTGFARKVVLLGMAVLFALACLASLHVLVWVALLTYTKINALSSLVIIVLGDLVLMMLFFLVGLRRKADEEAIKARIIRDHNLQELRRNLAFTAVLGTLGGPLGEFLLGRIRRFLRRGSH